MARLRIAVIGCVALSEALLRKLIDMPQSELAGVVTRSSSPINSDFRSLEPLARQAGSPVLLVDGNDQNAIADFLRAQAPELVFCVGWSYLLKPDVLTIAPRGVVGYHPAALPQNRGRHPLIWALALGLRETASTFFLMDATADSGPILHQRKVPIKDDDDAASLYARMTETALAQIDALVPALIHGTIKPVPQDHRQANIWRKRGHADGLVDWRMSASGIRNLVRALSWPYPGAHCETGGTAIRIWKADIGPAAPVNIEPGRVLAVQGREITVKCYDGSVCLTEHEFDRIPAVGSTLCCAKEHS